MSGSAYARTTDPETSHQAARAVNANRLEHLVLVALEECGPSTVKQIAFYLGIHEWSISPRLRPLATRGLVRDTDRRIGRSIVWEAI